MLFSDFLALIIITIFGIYSSSNVEEIILFLRVLVGLPLCIIGIIFISKSKSSQLIKKSILLASIGLILLTIDLWIVPIIALLIEDGPYTSLFIKGITLILSLIPRLLGLTLFIIGAKIEVAPNVDSK